MIALLTAAVRARPASGSPKPRASWSTRSPSSTIRATPTPLASLLASAGLLVLLVVLKDAGFAGIRNLFSSDPAPQMARLAEQPLQRRAARRQPHPFSPPAWRATATAAPAAPDNVDQRVQESIKGMTGGAIGLAMGVVGVVTSLYLRRPEAAARPRPRSNGLEFLGGYGSAVAGLHRRRDLCAAQHHASRSSSAACWSGSPSGCSRPKAAIAAS